MKKTVSPEATDLVLRCLNRNPEKRWASQSLLRHAFFARYLGLGTDSSYGEKPLQSQSTFNIVLSSKVSPKVLPEDDLDLEDMFKSNTTPFVSPSFANSTRGSSSPQDRRICNDQQRGATRCAKPCPRAAALSQSAGAASGR